MNKRYSADLANPKGKQFLEVRLKYMQSPIIYLYLFKCIQAMRPVQKTMKKFVTSEILNSTESIRNLLKVGDHMAAYLAEKATTSASDVTLEKWHSYLWIFLSRFTKSQEDASKLLQMYRDAVKLRNANPNIMVCE